MKPKTCIITPTWNNTEYTIRCFDSIRKNTKDYKIIWIDNGSEPESREAVQKFLKENNVPHEAILNKENLGFVKGTNQGMKRALEIGSDYLVFENNDTEVYEGWLERMIEVAESDPKIGLVGPITSPCESWQSIEVLKMKNDRLKDKSIDFSILPKYENNPEEYSRKVKELFSGRKTEVSPMVAFFCTLVKMDTVKDIGVLGEEYGVGLNDDDDYCTRARQAGWKIALALDVFVFHNHRTTFKARYTEDEIKEMKKKNLTKFGKKFEDDKGYDFERFFETGKMHEYKGEKEAVSGKGKPVSESQDLFKKARFVLKKDGPIKFLKYTWKYIRYGRKRFN